MTPKEMKRRTKAFALNVLRFVESLPKSRSADAVARQLLRAGMSVGANYRAACRSRSDGEFLARTGVVEEEADEALYWLELLLEAGMTTPQKAATLQAEADEILSMIVASINTVKARTRRAKDTAGTVPSSSAGRAAAVNPKSEIRNPK
jgi:four helix bundle protein